MSFTKKMSVICDRCGTENLSTSKFCTECGQNLRTSKIKHSLDSSTVPPELASGVCSEQDDSIKWQLLDNGDLKITGHGPMMRAYRTASDMAPWYAYRRKIRRVLISDGVQTIGEHMFRECENLETVIIPGSVYRIGLFAFYDCKNLSEIHGAENVSFIGANAFRDCSRLQDESGFVIVNRILTEWFGKEHFVKIPEGVSVIGDCAFFSNLDRGTVPEVVIIPDGVKKIENHAFWGCKGLRFVNIPDSVEEIESWCFEGCCSLKVVYINEMIERQISGSAFSSCALEGEGSAMIIGGILFRYHGNEISYTIPQNVREISPKAFKNCSSLQEIILPKTVKKIGYNVFENCQNLRRVEMKSPVSQIEETFKNCAQLESIVLPDTINTIGIGTFEGCTNLKTVVLPKTVRSIRRSAFSECKNLEEIRLPESLSDIDIEPSAFYGCIRLADSRLRQFMRPDPYNPRHRKILR